MGRDGAACGFRYDCEPGLFGAHRAQPADRRGNRFATVAPGAVSIGPSNPGRDDSGALIAGAPCRTRAPGRSHCGTAQPGVSVPPPAWYRPPEQRPPPTRWPAKPLGQATGRRKGSRRVRARRSEPVDGCAARCHHYRVPPSQGCVATAASATTSRCGGGGTLKSSRRRSGGPSGTDCPAANLDAPVLEDGESREARFVPFVQNTDPRSSFGSAGPRSSGSGFRP